MKATSKSVEEIEASLTLRIDSKAKELKREGKDLVLFTAGEPDFNTPQEVKEAAIKAINEDFTKYTKSSGIFELREGICEKLRKDNGLSYSPDEIVVSNGGKQALFNALGAILNPDDEVIIITPAWITYFPQVKLWKARPVKVKTFPENDYLPKKEDIENVVNDKTKAILFNSPNNPTGAVYDLKTIEMLAEVAIKHDLYVIADEVYEKMVYDLPHISIASLDGMRERTITINGFSKSHAMTGWRVGYSAAPLEISKEISKIQSHTTSNINSIAQKAALKALSVDTQYMMDEYRKRRDLISDLLEKANFDFFKPKGAFYVMINVNEFLNDHKSTEDLCMELMEKAGVAMIPADAFDMKGFVRLSFATSQEMIKEGVRRLTEYLK